MAVIDDFDEQPIEFKKSVKALEPTHFETHDDLGLSVINNKESNLGDIIQYVGGYKWKGNYYNNLSNINDKTNNHSIMLDKTIQKYNKIEDLIIYLDDTLSNNVKLEDIELEGKINAGIIPYVGDMFISNMIGGRGAVFSITEVDTLTYQLHKIYKVKIKFFQFLDNYKKEFADLEDKVVQVYYYDTRFIINYGSPILLKEEYKDKLDFSGYKLKLIDKYLNLFLDKESSLLNIFASPFVLNGTRYEGVTTYLDPFMIRFFKKITNVEDNPKLLSISYPIEDDTYDFNYETILDLILNKGNIGDMMFIEKKLYWRRIDFSDSNPTLRHISYLNIDRVMDIVPEEATANISEQGKNYLFSRTENNDIDFPLNLDKDNMYYIFSESFYNNDFDNMSKFEVLISNYLSYGNISFSELRPFINSFNLWSKYEQYYIIPIIIHFINVLSTETFSTR